MARPILKRKDEPEGLALRFAAGLIAIPVFELSLLLGCYLAAGRRLAAHLFFVLPLWLHVAYSSVALLVGLVFGFAGLTWLLGHLFMTHFPKDKDLRVTAVLWVCICVLAFIGYRAAGAR